MELSELLKRTSRNVGTFVVSPQKEEVLRIFDFVAQQEKNGFQTLLSAINVVAKEEVVCCRWEPAHLEEPDKVGILSMDVTNYLDWRRQFDKCRLTEEYLAGCLADGDNFCVLEAQGLANLASIPYVQQSLNHIVDVESFRLGRAISYRLANSGARCGDWTGLRGV